jgi:hypothetical protein
MNIDPKTPIGKVVDTSSTDLERPEVVGHQLSASDQDALQENVTSEATEDSRGEVEGHFRARLNHEQPRDEDKDEREVKGRFNPRL